MIESVLTQKGFALKHKIAIKSVISFGIVTLAVLLPQFVHLIAGAQGGVTWLPMYLPVLIGGCILGWKWGLAIGVLSPLASFLVTLAAGNPMPAAARLPFMMVELAVFAAVSGIFSKKIVENGWMAFPAVILAAVCGRATFIALVAIFQSLTPFSVAMIWGQIQTGFIGLIAQCVLVPFIVMALRALIIKDNKESAEEKQ